MKGFFIRPVGNNITYFYSLTLKSLYGDAVIALDSDLNAHVELLDKNEKIKVFSINLLD